jgi:hypothetical protein
MPCLTRPPRSPTCSRSSLRSGGAGFRALRAMGVDPAGQAPDAPSALGGLPGLQRPSAREPQAKAGERHAVHRLERDGPRAVGNRRRRPPAYYHSRHDRRRQDDRDPESAGQCPRPGLGVRAGRRQGGPRTVRQGAGARPPVRPRRRRPRVELHGRLRPQGQPFPSTPLRSGMPTQSASCWRVSSASSSRTIRTAYFASAPWR